MTHSEWKAIEADFREWAFYRYYHAVYANVRSSGDRFALALLASIAPIKDRRGVVEWHRRRTRRRGSAITREACQQIVADVERRRRSRRSQRS